MVKHLNIRVYGRVKGVDFRATAREQAESLGLAGFARNEEHTVYIEAEGQPAALERFVAWCREGTPWSRVERVEAEEGELKHFQDFKVIRSFPW